MTQLLIRSAFISLLFASMVAAQENTDGKRRLRLFNTDVFRKTADSPVVLFESKRPDLIDPITVQVDVQNDRFHAATICYPDEIDAKDARDSINRKFRKWALPGYDDNDTGGVWRNEKEKFAISLARYEDEGLIRVVYICFIGDKTTSSNEAEQRNAREIAD